jgi:hypothetical protein
MESSSFNLITKGVAAALNRTKMSDREAVYVLNATTHFLGHNIQQLLVSRSSIQRLRKQLR